MELAAGLWDLLVRDKGWQRHAQPSLRAPVRRILRGKGGEGSRFALPPLPYIVHGLRKPYRAAYCVAGGKRSGESLAYGDGAWASAGGVRL